MRAERIVVDGGVWIEKRDNQVSDVGLTKEAVESFGGIEYIQLPPLGTVFAQNDVAAVLESNKVAIDIETPLSGTVVAIHENISGPFTEDVWLFSIKSDD
jgi:glycine cleavage system H protein